MSVDGSNIERSQIRSNWGCYTTPYKKCCSRDYLWWSVCFLARGRKGMSCVRSGQIITHHHDRLCRLKLFTFRLTAIRRCGNPKSVYDVGACLIPTSAKQCKVQWWASSLGSREWQPVVLVRPGITHILRNPWTRDGSRRNCSPSSSVRLTRKSSGTISRNSESFLRSPVSQTIWFGHVIRWTQNVQL